jgi:hypothetical protein
MKFSNFIDVVNETELGFRALNFCGEAEEARAAKGKLKGTEVPRPPTSVDVESSTAVISVRRGGCSSISESMIAYRYSL